MGAYQRDVFELLVRRGNVEPIQFSSIQTMVQLDATLIEIQDYLKVETPLAGPTLVANVFYNNKSVPFSHVPFSHEP